MMFCGDGVWDDARVLKVLGFGDFGGIVLISESVLVCVVGFQ